MKIVLNGIEYKLVKNYKDCFDNSEVQNKLNDTDYFNEFDYILGDYSYDKLRLKGFLRKTNKDVKPFNNYDKIDDYIKNYCSDECRYFILEKAGIIETNEEIEENASENNKSENKKNDVKNDKKNKKKNKK